MKPIYPIYIPTKGRYESAKTIKCFLKDGVDFSAVVEPQEYEEYHRRYPTIKILQLPFSNLGLGSMPARNWIWDHAKATGAKRHWIFDDNIRVFGRLFEGRRIPCNANLALKVVEDFTDRYENIAIAGFNYRFFVPNDKKTPFTVNCHVYSAMLLLNDQAARWRMRYNEDTDLCLQVLHNRLCTVLFHAFHADKITTMVMKGGNTDELYQGDGRLKMARSLEAMWPQYVEVKWRYGRPQHVIKNNWKNFTHPLIKRKDIDWDKIKKQKYNIKLIQRNKIKSKTLQKFYNES